MTPLLIITGILTRLIPHWPNFTAVGGLTLFAGAIGNKKTSWLIPLAIMGSSDLILTRNAAHFWHGATLAVYASFLLIWWLGHNLTSRRPIWKITLTSIASSLVFFLVTNNVFFIIGPSLYPRTTAGLMTSYLAGLPFLTPMLISDLLTSVLLFVGYAWLTRWQPKRASVSARVPAAIHSS